MAIKAGFLMPHPPILIPEVGRGKEQEAFATIDGMKAVAEKIAHVAPETIIVITPHGPVFSDAILIHDQANISGDLSSFGAPEVKISKSNDQVLVNRILEVAAKENIAVATLNEDFASMFQVSDAMDHGTLVPLYFIEQVYSSYNLVSITYGLLGHETLYRFGMALQEAATDLGISAVVIASGDLSHKLKEAGPYPYSPQGSLFDHELMSMLKNQRFEDVVLMDSELCDAAAECGKRSVDIMLGAMDGYVPTTKIYSYEGPFGVGYGVAEIELGTVADAHQHLAAIIDRKAIQLKTIRENEDAYVRLARAAMTLFVQTGKRYELDDAALEDEHLKSMVNHRAGVFVSIKNSGGLRGCMGTIGGTEKNIAEEIISNAIKAAVEDPRFESVEADELDGLILSVDVLMPAEQIDALKDLDPKRYGVIVTSGYKRGLLLPNLKGIDTPEEQLRIAMSKGGIDEMDDYTLERFEVKRHK